MAFSFPFYLAFSCLFQLALTGVCPGNNESAGKRRSGKTRKGNSLLRTTLVICAQGASRAKGSFFSAQYSRLMIRRGKNRAKMAVAHSLLIAIYYIIRDRVPFHDLGADYYDRFNTESKIKMYIRKLEDLGVSINAEAATALA